MEGGLLDLRRKIELISFLSPVPDSFDLFTVPIKGIWDTKSGSVFLLTQLLWGVAMTSSLNKGGFQNDKECKK